MVHVPVPNSVLKQAYGTEKYKGWRIDVGSLACFTSEKGEDSSLQHFLLFARRRLYLLAREATGTTQKIEVGLRCLQAAICDSGICTLGRFHFS